MSEFYCADHHCDCFEDEAASAKNRVKELEAEKAELVELLKQSLDLFPLGVGAMANIGNSENQTRCGKEAKELYRRINEKVNKC